MTERKTLRSTKEWPLTFAIDKLRGIQGEIKEYRTELLEGIDAKVAARKDVLVARYLLHVPEDFRAHVAEKAGVAMPSNDSPPDPPQEDRPAWLDEAPKEPAVKPVVVDRSERKVPRQ